MPHETALIATIAAGLGLAFLFGLLAQRLRLPPILGYLLAGVAVGPVVGVVGFVLLVIGLGGWIREMRRGH